MKFRGHNKPLASRRIDGPQLTTIDSVTFFLIAQLVWSPHYRPVLKAIIQIWTRQSKI
jgi:hypothetical protein